MSSSPYVPSSINQLHPKLLPWLKKIAPVDASDVMPIQALWNNYGQIVRFYHRNDQQHYIAKLVCPDPASRHPKGWQSTIGHERKCRSYEVETHFYQRMSALTPQFAIPELVFTQTDNTGAKLLVLSDLNTLGYTHRHTMLSVAQCKPVLDWLAHFHSMHLQRDTQGLWPQGCYWHLDTRQEEWEAMQDTLLKRAAVQLDERLRTAHFQTWVHGDAKVANFCFSPTGEPAGVDFQYVGAGVGVIDVAYFLGSALSDTDLLKNTDSLLDYYFEQLVAYLAVYHPSLPSHALIEEWQGLYNIAVADFHRFLKGWSPEHWKINQDMTQRTEAALHSL